MSTESPNLPRDEIRHMGQVIWSLVKDAPSRIGPFLPLASFVSAAYGYLSIQIYVSKYGIQAYSVVPSRYLLAGALTFASIMIFIFADFVLLSAVNFIRKRRLVPDTTLTGSFVKLITSYRGIVLRIVLLLCFSIVVSKINEISGTRPINEVLIFKQDIPTDLPITADATDKRRSEQVREIIELNNGLLTGLYTSSSITQ